MISVLFLSLPCQCPLPRVFYDMWNHQHHLTTQGQDPFYLEYNTWHVCWYPAFQQWGWSTSAAPPPVLAITALWWARISVVLLFGQLSSAQSNEIPPGGWPCGWLACNPHITPWSTNPAFLQYHPTPPQTPTCLWYLPLLPVPVPRHLPPKVSVMGHHSVLLWGGLSAGVHRPPGLMAFGVAVSRQTGCLHFPVTSTDRWKFHLRGSAVSSAGILQTEFQIELR